MKNQLVTLSKKINHSNIRNYPDFGFTNAKIMSYRGLVSKSLFRACWQTKPRIFNEVKSQKSVGVISYGEVRNLKWEFF